MKTRLFALAFRLAPRVPRAVWLGLAPVAGTIIWLLAGSLRERVTTGLRHVPSLAANPERLKRTVRAAFTQLVLNYIDLFVPPSQSQLASLDSLFTLENVPLLAETLAQGKGCIIYSMHTSAFEWARYRLPQITTTPILGPMEMLQPPELFDLVTRERNKSGITFLPVTESQTLREMITALRRGEAVLVTVDRDVLRNGIVMPFFGAPALLPTGVIALARLTGAPILGAICWRDGPGRYHGGVIKLDLPIDKNTRGDDANRAALQPLVGLMEDLITQRPEQWLAAFAGDVWLTEPVTMAVTETATSPHEAYS